MSLRESSAVTKSNVNNVEVSSKTSPRQNTHKEEMSRSTRDCESEVSEKEHDEYSDFKRFGAVPKHDEFKWNLPENLAKCTSDHFNKFIPKKDFQESALVENPTPLNLHPLKKMDEFMRDMIFEKIAGSLEEAADSNLIKLQQKLLDVMRPLSKVWTIVENTSNFRFKQVGASLPEIMKDLD